MTLLKLELVFIATLREIGGQGLQPDLVMPSSRDANKVVGGIRRDNLVRGRLTDEGTGHRLQQGARSGGC